MKLAFCLFKYFPYGGLQRDFFRIATLCRARGHEVHVYTSAWQGHDHAGLHIHIVKVNGWENHKRFESYVKAVHNNLAQEKFDVVIGFNKMPGLDIYYAADVCYVASASEKHTIFYRLLSRYRFHAAMEKAVFAPNQRTHILLITQEQQRIFTEYYQTEIYRFRLLPPGISKDRLATPLRLAMRARLRLDYGLMEHDKLILFIGSGFKTKGLDRVIKAVHALDASFKQHAKVWIVGQDRAAPFKRLAKRYRVANHIQFLGGRNDIPDLLLIADLLIHPAYYESAGAVLLEALIAGLPVLTTSACGYAPYIREAQAGIVLNSPFEQAALNEALHSMLLPENYVAWQTNALAFAKTADIYSLAERASDYIESYNEKPIRRQSNTFGNTILYQNNNLQAYDFDTLMNVCGDVFRDEPARLTQRIQLNHQTYFIKQHTGVGWREIIKNMLRFAWPVVGASNEWRALNKLRDAGLHAPKAYVYGKQGINPAKQHSFILMQALTQFTTLEDLTQTWRASPPTFAYKRALIAEVARIVRTMHGLGINHRDCYLCHFLLMNNERPLTIYLIDWHRAQIRKQVPLRWFIKDIASLYFSSKHCGLTKHDLLYFVKHYYEKPLRIILQDKQSDLKKIIIRGERVYRDHFN